MLKDYDILECYLNNLTIFVHKVVPNTPPSDPLFPIVNCIVTYNKANPVV